MGVRGEKGREGGREDLLKMKVLGSRVKGSGGEGVQGVQGG